MLILHPEKLELNRVRVKGGLSPAKPVVHVRALGTAFMHVAKF